MADLSERLEVRVAESTMARLRAAARRRRVSVGQIVREAIEHEVVEEHDRRLRAAEALFAIGVETGDWPEIERQIEAARADECG